MVASGTNFILSHSGRACKRLVKIQGTYDKLSLNYRQLDPSVTVQLDGGAQAVLRVNSLRNHFTAVLGALLEPYPHAVSPSNSPSSLFDTKAFAAEMLESYYVRYCYRPLQS